MKSEDRAKMLRMVWQVFTLLSIVLIVLGGGWGAVIALLGLALTTVLATHIIMRVGLVSETTDNRAIRFKAKRSDADPIDPLGESMREAEEAALGARLSADSSVIGDDGELVAVGERKVSRNTRNHDSIL